MKLGCLLLLGVGLLSCSAEKDVDPLASASGFCEEWAERACGEAVVNRCGADNKDDCLVSQAQFCEKLVPGSLYSQAGADKCLDAVEKAYKDGDLDAKERDTVRTLGAPCDLVLSGNGRSGDDCEENSDCDRAGGYDCIIPLGEAEGSCEKPKSVQGGLECGGPADVCASGFYCSESGDCLGRKSAGKECSEIVPCAGGLNCVIPEGSTAGICTARLENNEKGCEVDSDCASGICQKGNDRSVCSPKIQLDSLEEICDDLN
jgi:hypothetical protein